MATKKTSKANNGGAGKALAVGVGVAAVSAAAYLLFGPEGKKNRKKVQGWAVKMKGEMIEKFEKAQEVTEPIYHKVVDEVSAKYAKLKNVDKKDVDDAVAEVKKHWNALMRDVKPKAKKTAKKSPAKKSAPKKK